MNTFIRRRAAASLLFCCMLTSLFIAVPASAEFLFLKDGSIVEGSISDESDASITLITKEGKPATFPRARVMRVLYSSLFRELKSIRLVDGTEFQAYVIDEDAEKLTLRKILDKPEEFTVLRSKIYSTAKNSPTGLEGTAEGTSIKLSWQGPKGSSKPYAIYLREKNQNYPKEPAATTSQTRFTLKNLKINTGYHAIVVMEGSAANSANASNEVFVQTGDAGGKATNDIGLSLVARGAFILPIRYFGELYSFGAGALLSLSYDRLGVEGLTIGLEAGYLHLFGKSVINDYAYLLPCQLTLGYKIRVADFFSIMPFAGGGMVYNTVVYADAASTYGITRSSGSMLQPLFSAGLAFNFIIGPGVVINVGTSYWGIVENSGIADSIPVFVEVGYRF